MMETKPHPWKSRSQTPYSFSCTIKGHIFICLSDIKYPRRGSPGLWKHITTVICVQIFCVYRPYENRPLQCGKLGNSKRCGTDQSSTTIVRWKLSFVVIRFDYRLIERVHVHCKVRMSFQINWIWIDLVAAQGRSRCSRSEHTAAQKAAPPVGSHQIRRTRSKDSSTGNPWTTNGDIALLVKSFIQDLGWPYSCAHILEQMCNDYLCNN